MIFELRNDGVRYAQINDWEVELIPDGGCYKAIYLEEDGTVLEFSVAQNYNSIRFEEKNFKNEAIKKKLFEVWAVFKQMEVVAILNASMEVVD